MGLPRVTHSSRAQTTRLDFWRALSQQYKGLAAALKYAGFVLDEHEYARGHDSNTTAESLRASAEPTVSPDTTTSEALEPIGTQLPATGNNDRKRKVFVSHAGEDSEIVLRLARLVRTACNLQQDEIVCTSADEFSLSIGLEWKHELREVINENAIVIFYLSPAFLESRFCGFEMGAVWIAKEPRHGFPIRKIGFDVEKLDVLAGDWQCPELSRTSLEFLVERLCELSNQRTPTPSTLSAHIAEYFPEFAH